MDNVFVIAYLSLLSLAAAATAPGPLLGILGALVMRVS